MCSIIIFELLITLKHRTYNCIILLDDVIINSVPGNGEINLLCIEKLLFPIQFSMTRSC